MTYSKLAKSTHLQIGCKGNKNKWIMKIIDKKKYLLELYEYCKTTLFDWNETELYYYKFYLLQDFFYHYKDKIINDQKIILYKNTAYLESLKRKAHLKNNLKLVKRYMLMINKIELDRIKPKVIQLTLF